MRTWMQHKYSPIGLDIGRTAIRAVQLRRRDHGLHLYSAFELGNGGLSDAAPGTEAEPMFDEPQAIEQIKRLRESGGFIGRDVVLHCPTSQLDMRPVDLPAGEEGLPREAILGALRLQLGSHLPFPADQAVYDYLPIHQAVRPGMLRVMAITADAQWIKERIRWIESGGMHCIEVDALPCALTRLSILCDGSEKFSETSATSLGKSPDPSESNYFITAVLDIGFSGSTLIVHDGQGSLFCRRFSIGGREMSEILAQRLTVSFSQAEQFKRRFGIDCASRQLCLVGSVAEANSEVASSQSDSSFGASNSSSSQADIEIGKTIFAALQSDLSNYVEGLTRSLNYVITNSQGARLRQIHLAGAACHTRNLDRYLSEQFELPVRILAHPLLEEITNELPATRAQAGNWTTALGLALKQMEGTCRE
jgi:type IV pilus assembly protein PilM